MVQVKYKYHYLMLFPMIVWVFIFWYLPIYGILIAFQNKQGWTLSNFWFLRDSEFWRVMLNTIRIGGLKWIVGFPVPIILALILNEVTHKKFKKIVQTIIYLPHFISWVIFSGIIYRLLDPEGGLLSLFHVVEAPIGKEGFFIGLLVVSNIVKEAGWGTIIYLAAISQVDPQLYEACEIDGGGRWVKAMHVTIPGILGTVLILAILSLPNLISAGFDQVWNLQNPMVYGVSNVTDVYVLRIGIQKGEYSYGAAMGLVFSLIGLCLVIISNRLSKQTVGQGIW